MQGCIAEPEGYQSDPSSHSGVRLILLSLPSTSSSKIAKGTKPDRLERSGYTAANEEVQDAVHHVTSNSSMLCHRTKVLLGTPPNKATE